MKRPGGRTDRHPTCSLQSAERSVSLPGPCDYTGNMGRRGPDTSVSQTIGCSPDSSCQLVYLPKKKEEKPREMSLYVTCRTVRTIWLQQQDRLRVYLFISSFFFRAQTEGNEASRSAAGAAGAERRTVNSREELPGPALAARCTRGAPLENKTSISSQKHMP